MPLELAQLRNPAGKILVGILWLMTPVVIALACHATSGRSRLIGSSMILAGVTSIAWWVAGSARLARLIVSVCFAGQVSLLLEVGHGTLLDGSLDMLPFAALVALVAYGDRRVVVTAGVLLAAVHVTAWRTSEPASAMAVYVAIMAVHVAGLSWLARKLRGLALRAAHARHAAAAAHLTLVSPWQVQEGSSSRLELTVPAFSPAPRRGRDRGPSAALLSAGQDHTDIMAVPANASGELHAYLPCRRSGGRVRHRTMLTTA
jgi:hypothetical protein